MPEARHEVVAIAAASAEAEQLGSPQASAISADVAVVDVQGVNTPQFAWCKTTLTHHPKPIGTYYEPEVAARAIYRAAHARRAEICAGAPTPSTVLAEKFVPAPARPVPGPQSGLRQLRKH
jgi:hypothetical protein